MAETSKAKPRRSREGFFDLYCRGRGIDIGVGRIDSVGADPLLPDIDTWDKDNGDATFMIGVQDETYDFVYSSHCLEHIENPALALKNWFRILKPGGFLLLYVPHRDLYESRTELPSVWNGDHKFFLLPDRDEPPFTLGLLPLLAGNLSGIQSLRVYECREGWSPVPDGTHPHGEYSIEAIIEKR